MVFGGVARIALVSACLATLMLTRVPSGTLALEEQAAAPPKPVSGAPAGPGGIVLDFGNADIEMLVQAVSEIVGFSYVLAPDVHGTVSVRTSGAIRREDVFPVFLSILEAHGFTAVQAGEVYKIVRTETARERAIPTFIDPQPRSMTPPGVDPPPVFAGAAVAPPAFLISSNVNRFPSPGESSSSTGMPRPAFTPGMKSGRAVGWLAATT